MYILSSIKTWKPREKINILLSLSHFKAHTWYFFKINLQSSEKKDN